MDIYLEKNKLCDRTIFYDSFFQHIADALLKNKKDAVLAFGHTWENPADNGASRALKLRYLQKILSV